MSDYQEFANQFSDKYKGLAQKTADFMKGRDVSSLMGDDLYEYFGTKTAISKTKFYLLRSAIIDFVRFTNHPDKEKIINRISQVSQAQLAKQMDETSIAYKNLDEVLDLLNQIVTEEKLHSTDATPLQSIAILIWMGYSDIDIIEFKVSDISGLKGVAEEYKEILRTYAELKYYRALPSGRVQNLVQSTYLFRTANAEKLTECDIRKIISKINSLVVDKNKTFTRAVLKRSAAFVDMYKHHNINITPDVIRSYFGQSKKIAEIEKIIVEYQKWVERL